MRSALAFMVLLLAATLPLGPAGAGSPPSEPTSFTAMTGAAVGSIELAWAVPVNSGSSPVAGYRIYRSLASSGLTHLVDLGSSLSFTDSTITDGAPRYYRVSAVNGDGEGILSPVVNATAKAPPSVPRNPVAYTGPTRGDINVTWALPAWNGTDAPSSYEVHRASSLAGPYVYHASAATRWYIDSGLPDNTTMFYRIAAVNTYGTGPLSVVTSGTTMSPPSVPKDFNADWTPGLGVFLSWSPPERDGGSSDLTYYVYRSVGTAPEKLLRVTGYWQPSYTDRQCPILQECSYRVRARNDIGFGPYTEIRRSLGDDII